MPTLETERLVARLGSATHVAWGSASGGATGLVATPENKSRDRLRSAGGRSAISSLLAERGLDRPKSTPVRAQSASQHSRGSMQQRPHTSAGETDDAQCSRVMQVYREPVRKHNLTSSLPVKRPKAQSALAPSVADGIPTCFQVGPGYVMYRSKSRISMNINADEFWGKEEKKAEVVRCSPGPREERRVEDDYKDQLIAQLQEQVNDLKLFLEEEKLNHKDTISRCAEELRVRLQDATAQHMHETKLLQERHLREMEQMRLRFEEELQRERAEAEETENKLRQDIDFLHASFESYKSALAVEVQDRIKEREAEMRKEFDLDLQRAMQEMRVAFNREKMAEKAQWQQEANREQERLRREHRKEMDSLARKFADAQALLEKLNQTTDELNALKEEHEFLKEEKARLASQLKSVEVELEKTQTRLQQFQDSFEERVRRVDEQYRLKIEGLQRQSIDLRRAYMTKCDELVEEKTRGDMRILDRMESAKDAMRNVIEARNRAAISIAALDEDDEREKTAFERPVSAPVTDPELRRAQDCAGQARRERTD